MIRHEAVESRTSLKRWMATASALKGRLPAHVRRRLPPIWFGSLRRVTPLSDRWGFDRGTPIDRYYIEQFLAQHRQDIRGTALEVLNSRYVDRFGVGVDRCDILDIDATNPRATVIADLADANGIPDDVYDVFVLTQTLQLIFDSASAVRHAHRILKPGGTLLVTVPSISRLVPEHGVESDYWRFTPASCRQLFAPVFGAQQVAVTSYGNVLTDIAFLAGLAREELAIGELAVHDPYFPLIVAVRAVKTHGDVTDDYADDPGRDWF